jgi:hypothetical protein
MLASSSLTPYTHPTCALFLYFSTESSCCSSVAATSDTMIQTATPTDSDGGPYVRDMIGPLTTIFIPPGSCANCYDLSVNNSNNPILATCTAYYSNCQSLRPCLPTPVGPANGFGFYSPGLFCPDGWTKAVTYDQNMNKDWMLTISMLLSTLLPDETGAICCPP